jgi:hypothetical protein
MTLGGFFTLFLFCPAESGNWKAARILDPGGEELAEAASSLSLGQPKVWNPPTYYQEPVQASPHSPVYVPPPILRKYNIRSVTVFMYQSAPLCMLQFPVDF